MNAEIICQSDLTAVIEEAGFLFQSIDQQNFPKPVLSPDISAVGTEITTIPQHTH